MVGRQGRCDLRESEILPRRRGAEYLLSHVLFASVLLAATFAQAAEKPPTVPLRQIAQADQVRDFAIPSQSLASALDRFADQSGLSFAYRSGDLSALRSQDVSGRLTPAAALERLLAGTGIKFQFIDTKTVMLTRAPSSAPVQLGTVVVESERTRESAYGPVDGYVASRSSTGTKTDTPLIEVPQSISVITAKQMDDRATQNLSDTLRYTAGVQASDTNDLTSESFSLRGFNSPYLSLHRDGTRQMFRAFDSVVEPFGVERIEVLRGPASVLYGQGVPGGVVNLVTKRPTATAFGEIQGLAGSYDRYQGAVDFGGPLTEDKSVRYRLTALGREADTQTDFVRDDRTYVAPALSLHALNGNTTLTFLTSYQRDKTSFPDGLPAAGTVLSNPNGHIPTSRFTGEPDWSGFDRTSYSAGYIFDHEFSETYRLQQTLRYTQSSYDRNQIQNRGFDADLRAIDRRARQAFQDSDRVNVDTYVGSKFDTGFLKHDVIAGVDYGWAWFKTKMWQGNIDPLDLFTPTYGAIVDTPNPLFDDRQRSTQLGVYLQDQIKIGENLILVGGVRQDWAEDNLSDRLNGTSTTQRDNDATFRLGAVYLTSMGLAPYVSYSQSFVPVSGTDAQGNLFKPETGEQYEVGVKYQPTGLQSFITLSLFHLTRQNVQTPDPSDPDFLVQTGEVTVKGVELEGVASLTKNVNLLASYSYLDAEVTKSNDVDLGKIPTTVPRHMASVWGDYAIKDGDLAGLSAGLGVRYIGRTPGDMANTFFVPAVTLADAAMRYQVGPFRFAVNVNNVFDKEYASTCFSDNSCYYGQRRMVIGRLSYHW